MSLNLSISRLGLSGGGGNPPAFNISFTGLSTDSLGNYGQVGNHAAISYTITPDLTTETVKWSNSSNPADAATFGTGANPTDFTSVDGFSVYLHVTDDPADDPDVGPVTRTFSFSARYTPGTASAVADGQSFTVDTAITPINAAASGANLTFSYALSGGPAGLSINSGTGEITGTPTAASSGTATITATDQYGRTYVDTFTYTASLRAQATAANGLGPYNWTVDDTTVNVNAATDFTANGNTLTYSATGLPAGVTINSAGTISGTPTAASSGSIVITATDEYGRQTTSTTSHTTALRAQATGGADLDLAFPEDVAISSTNLVANWTANGNTLTFVSVSPSLPTGLSIASNGTMTGTPTTITADATYTLTMQDEYGRQTSDTFTLEITDASFSPASLFASSEQGGWYDPSDLSTLWKDTAGTDPVTADGDAVARIDDKSGNGNHLTQADSAKRPLYKTDTTLHWLQFDGTDDILSSAAFNPATNAAQAFIGITRVGTGGAIIFETSNDAGATNGALNMQWISSGRVAVDSRGTTRASVTSALNTFNPPITRVGTYESNIATPNLNLRMDGVQALNTTASHGTGNYGNHALNLGARATGSLFIQGNCYGLILRFGSDLSSTTRGDAETWMAAKTGVTL